MSSPLRPPWRRIRLRRAGHRYRRIRHGDGGDGGFARPEGAGRREGAALRRHHRPLRRLAVDPRHPARHRAGHPRARRRGRRRTCKHETTTHFDAARVDAFLENGPKAVDFFTRKTCRAVRHAAGVSRLPRRSAGRPARRPLDGHAPVRRPRTRPAHQGPRAAAARTHRVRNDVGLGQGDQTLHARVQVGRVVRLRHQAPERATSSTSCATAAA